MRQLDFIDRSAELKTRLVEVMVDYSIYPKRANHREERNAVITTTAHETSAPKDRKYMRPLYL